MFNRIIRTTNADNHVHILCSTKTIAERIYNGGWLESANLTVGGRDNQFDPTTNNIGTTFASGVNVLAGDTLVIILPFSEPSKTIFSLGRSVLDQAIARLRGSGKIILVTPPLRYWVDPEHYAIIKRELPHHLISKYKTNDTSQSFDREKEYLFEQYQRQYPNDVNNTDLVVSTYKYEDYRLYKGDKVLANALMISGKWSYPYLVWAAIKGDISNCNQPKFTHQKFIELQFVFDPDDRRGSIIGFIKNNYNTLESSINFSGLENLFISLHNIFQYGCLDNTQLVISTPHNKSIQDIASQSTFKQQLISIIFEATTGIVEADRGDYLFYRALQAKDKIGLLAGFYIEIDETLKLINEHIKVQLGSNFPFKASIENYPALLEYLNQLDKILSKIFKKDKILKLGLWQKPSAYFLMKKHYYKCMGDTTYKNERVSKIVSNNYEELKYAFEGGLIKSFQFQ